MGYDVDNMWRVWSDLERKEDELKWGGRLSGVGPQYNSMGRPANASAHFNNGWASEQMGRVNRVRKALNDSGPMARNMIARTLSDIDLSTIWPILVSACQDIALYYGGSAAAGGLIGGVGGAFFGGVGAVPGAAAGAAAGGYVGGWVLAMLGLKSLVEGVAQAIPEALRCYEKGFLEAWGPTRHDHQHGFGMVARGDPSFAAMHLANGHVIMISAILSVLAAYVTKGKGDILKDIRQSPRLGPRVASWVEENKDKLGRHLALQSRGRGASPGTEPPPQKPRREPTKEQGGSASGSTARSLKIARVAKADDGANRSGSTGIVTLQNETNAISRNSDRLLLDQMDVPEFGKNACGPTACGMVLGDQGVNVNIYDFSKRAGINVDGTDAIGLARAMQQEGMNSAHWAHDLSIEDLTLSTSKGHSAIAQVELAGGRTSHFVVVDGIGMRPELTTGSLVSIRDPMGGTQYYVPLDEFERRFTGWGITTHPKVK